MNGSQPLTRTHHPVAFIGRSNHSAKRPQYIRFPSWFSQRNHRTHCKGAVPNKISIRFPLANIKNLEIRCGCPGGCRGCMPWALVEVHAASRYAVAPRAPPAPRRDIGARCGHHMHRAHPPAPRFLLRRPPGPCFGFPVHFAASVRQAHDAIPPRRKRHPWHPFHVINIRG